MEPIPLFRLCNYSMVKRLPLMHLVPKRLRNQYDNRKRRPTTSNSGWKASMNLHLNTEFCPKHHRLYCTAPPRVHHMLLNYRYYELPINIQFHNKLNGPQINNSIWNILPTHISPIHQTDMAVCFLLLWPENMWHNMKQNCDMLNLIINDQLID